MKQLSLAILFFLAVLPIVSAAKEVRQVEGISIIGNRELPKSLIIVPWKGSTLSDEPNLPEKSIIDQGFDFISRDKLLREIEFYKLQK